MRKFGIYIVIFFVGVVGLYAAYYMYKSYTTQLPQADIYVWGDSRMYWGLNVELLEERTGKKVCPTQQEGASVYDMLTFVNKVPAHSICIVGLSECVLFRDHASDYNRSGMNMWASWQLLKSGYSLKDVYGISKLNIWTPKQIQTQQHDYFAPANTVVTPESMPGWVIMYQKHYPYFEAKKLCYNKAIKTLLAKDCQVLLLDFAGYQDVETMAVGTPNRLNMSAYVDSLFQTLSIPKENIYLSTDTLLYYDLSHLNEIGATAVAENILPYINKTNYVRIHSIGQ